MTEKIKVGLADDHPLLRRGMISVISPEENLEIIWEAQNGSEVLEKVKLNPPEILILDINMPVLDGIQAAKSLAVTHPDVKIIFLSMYKDQQLFETMRKYRVKGYVLKDSALNEIVSCINFVSQGKNYITPELTELLFQPDETEITSAEPVFVVSNLTKAEKQVIELITDSKTSREIADSLFISIRTVENHRLNICRKLKLKGNHALIKFALSHKQSIKNLLK